MVPTPQCGIRIICFLRILCSDLHPNGNDTSEDNPLVLDEEEDQHNAFEFPTNKFPSKGFHFQDCYIMLAFEND